MNDKYSYPSYAKANGSKNETLLAKDANYTLPRESRPPNSKALLCSTGLIHKQTEHTLYDSFSVYQNIEKLSNINATWSCMVGLRLGVRPSPDGSVGVLMVWVWILHFPTVVLALCHHHLSILDHRLFHVIHEPTVPFTVIVITPFFHDHIRLCPRAKQI